MPQGKDVHVLPHDGRWEVLREGSSQPLSVHNNQAEAFEAGRDAAERSHGELLIHGRDGQIRQKDSHDNDPFPPAG